jgi:hypothetical protein
MGDLQQLCRAGVAGLSSVAGAVVLLAPAAATSRVVASSEPQWQRIGELADALGEGPCVDAARMLRPVLVPDLVAAQHRWPTYAAALARVGVSAVFSFPLQVGAANLGVLDFYAHTPAGLEPADHALALSVAQVATSVLLNGAQASPRPGDPFHALAALLATEVPDVTASPGVAEVHQAQGMLMVVLGVDRDRAMLELRARATRLGRPLSDLARDVVSGTVDPRTWRDGASPGPGRA